MEISRDLKVTKVAKAVRDKITEGTTTVVATAQAEDKATTQSLASKARDNRDSKQGRKVSTLIAKISLKDNKDRVKVRKRNQDRTTTVHALKDKANPKGRFLLLSAFTKSI